MQIYAEAFRFCPLCGGELEDKTSHKKCPKCDKSHYTSPKPTSTCIIKKENGEYLLVRRNIDPFNGWWDLPGGFLDEYESFEEGAIRETLEETGLHVKDLEYVASRGNHYDFQEVRFAVAGVMFVATVKNNVQAIAGDDASDFSWFKAEDIPIEEIAFDKQREFFKAFLHRD